MSTYRSRLEAGVHPGTVARRGAELRADLGRLAVALTPRWRPTGGRDDFGSALLRIGARLAEETTQRLAGTARRDALAFFDFLGLPPAPPRPATGVLVMALEPKHSAAVHAPVRTQVAVTGADGEETTFETRAALRVVPGGVAELVVVDPKTDHIERAPARVTSVAVPPALPWTYEVVTFAGVQSRTLQLSPATGLTADDVLRVGTSAHRVLDAEKNGLVTLRDPLEAPAAAGTTVTRIASLESFTMRDLQRHVCYVGHTELLNLEQRASIGLDLRPTSLARELSRLDVEYSMHGTREGQDEPDWHPLELVRAQGSEVRLAKTWVGPAEETEVEGRSSRWIRVELREKIAEGFGLTSRVSAVRLTVASADSDAESGAGTPAGGALGSGEGSRTVARATHNGTPLATTRRFYPFGAEPLRFDVFALAAPEALSKKGATVSLSVDLTDSSMVAFDVTVGAATGLWNGYGVGLNGDLEVLLNEDDRLRWLEISVFSADGLRVLLGAVTPVAINESSSAADVRAADFTATDVVVVGDRDGGLWSAVVRRAGIPVNPTVDGIWHPLGRPDAQESGPAGTPVVVPAPASMVGTIAVALDVLAGDVHARPLGRDGKPGGPWAAVGAQDGAAPAPVLSSADQLVPVQGAAWPLLPERLEVVARDDAGALWVGTFVQDPAAHRFLVRWSELTAAEEGPGHEVPSAWEGAVPAATRFRTVNDEEHVWVCFATVDDTGRQDGICGIDLVDAEDGHVRVRAVPDTVTVEVVQGSTLHASPAVLGVGGTPTVVGSGPTQDDLLLWSGGRSATTTPLPRPACSARPRLVGIHTGRGAPRWEILVAGTGERLLRASQSQPLEVSYSLHDLVELRGTWAPDRVEITKTVGEFPESTMVVLGDDNRRIYGGKVRVYELDDPELSEGMGLRFLRFKRPKEPYAGSFKPPDDRTRVKLADGDTDTAPGYRLVIDGASYSVEAVDTDEDEDTVATLDTDVVGDPTEYYVADKFEEGEVSADHLGTLVRLEMHEAPNELAFDAATRPRIQEVRMAGSGKNPVWVRLGRAWEAPPEGDKPAAVPGAPHWSENVRGRQYRTPELSWEYYDGDGWQRLAHGFRDGTEHLSRSGTIDFVVPPDITTTEIGGKEDYWIRARLIGGDYGRASYVVRNRAVEKATDETGDEDTTQHTIEVDTTDLNPPEILAIEASFSSPAASPPEFVVVENNADVLDQTQAAAADWASFDFFQGAAAIDPGTPGRALFAGLTGTVGAGPVTFLVDAVDQPGNGALQVDVRMASGWQRVPVDDRTASMRRTGMITVSLPNDPVTVRLFGHDRVWLRFRPGGEPVAGAIPNGADDRPWAPVIRALLPNAVTVSQARTMEDEVLGSSLGAPGTTVFLAGAPVLPDSVELRVRENLSDEERTQVEDQHGTTVGPSPGTPKPAVLADLDRAPGAWVLWSRVDSLVGQAGDARVYVLDPASGRVVFGDDRTGRIPPAGRDGIRCFSYQQGGGAAGNVVAWSETKLTTAVAGVETAALPIGTAGGVDPPSPGTVLATAPHQLRHAGSASTPADVESLVVASSGDVLRARCGRPDGPGDPVRIAVLVRDAGSRRPEPTHAQLEAIAAFVHRVGWGGLDDGAVEVSGPRYFPVAVQVALIAPPERWAEVEQDARARLIAFFDPGHGGPYGTGWPFGRRPAPADLLRALRKVGGIDRVAAADIVPLDGTGPDELPFDGMVCAEVEDITVSVSGEGSEP